MANLTIEVRTYGSHGPPVIAIHGGPGAGGTMAPVTRGLAGSFRVYEPIQRGSGKDPLTVSRHIEDLREVIEENSIEAPALVGHSWGAMLALAFATAHPALAGPIALIGCGTFDVDSRRVFQSTCEARMDDDLRREMRHVEANVTEPSERMRRMGSLYSRLDAYDVLDAEEEQYTFDARAHEETWSDMIRLQMEGVYPADFSAIRRPVVMLHGVYDPHPGRMIYANLRQHVPSIEYREWARCGHEPWLERAVREDFFSTLAGWLSAHASSDSATA